MLLSGRVLRDVVAGRVTVLFRRWASPQARPGARVETPEGVVGVGAVTRVDPAAIGEEEARRAGFSGAAGLRSSLARHGSGPVYRVEVAYLGPVAAEAEPVVLSRGERAELDRRLARWDVSAPRGPWTRVLLGALVGRAGVRPGELAGELGRPVSRVKSDLWRLRELGLVEPVAGGVRLSARGSGYLGG